MWLFVVTLDCIWIGLLLNIYLDKFYERKNCSSSIDRQYLFSPIIFSNTACKYISTYLKSELFGHCWSVGQIGIFFVYAQIQSGEQSSDLQLEQEIESREYLFFGLQSHWCGNFFLVHCRLKRYMDVAATLHSAWENQVLLGTELTVYI